MKILKILFFSLCAAILFSCSTIKVVSDYDTKVDFSTYKTFAFYKKDVLLEHPFDEHLAGKEDRYWINDKIKEGMKSYYDSDTICHHHYTTNGATWKGIG